MEVTYVKEEPKLKFQEIHYLESQGYLNESLSILTCFNIPFRQWNTILDSQTTSFLNYESPNNIMNSQTTMVLQ